MKVKNLAIEKLVPYENNPRNNEAAVDYVANSIKEFGFQVPIVVDKDNVIVAGHTRYKAAQKLGLTEVPVVVVAYIPKQISEGQYEVIGLSKIPRIVDLCAKRLQLQEKLAQDIAECISLATGSGDVFVNIKGDHACVSARGAKSDGFTDVTYMQGKFRENSELRNEIERKIRHI